MEDTKQPTSNNGKICYIEIPAVDINISVAFYKAVFDWNIRTRGDGSIAFNDSVDQVSGTWVLNRSPMTQVGLLIYIMVTDISKIIEAVVANGGIIVQSVGADAPEITARFSDPAGNILGLYQQR